VDSSVRILLKSKRRERNSFPARSKKDLWELWAVLLQPLRQLLVPVRVARGWRWMDLEHGLKKLGAFESAVQIGADAAGEAGTFRAKALQLE